MADQTVATASRVQRWESKFALEYQRQHKFAMLMGKSENAPFMIKTRLQKEAGDTINIPLFLKMASNPTLGDDTLEGNEENISNYNHGITINQRRWAIRRGDFEQQRTVVDLLEMARMNLKLRVMRDIESEIIRALLSPVTDGTTAYASATEGQKNTWVAAQNPAAGNHRVMFGDVFSNYSASNHLASLATIDNTMTWSRSYVEIAIRAMKNVDPAIRPVRINKKGLGSVESFVFLGPSTAFRDLMTDEVANSRDAELRGPDNPLFAGGDHMIRGSVCKEIEAIDELASVGSGSIDVAPVFGVGAQALGIAYGKRVFVRSKKFDYDNVAGVAIGEIRGVDKLMFNNVQHGVFTHYVSGVADS